MLHVPDVQRMLDILDGRVGIRRLGGTYDDHDGDFIFMAVVPHEVFSSGDA